MPALQPLRFECRRETTATLAEIAERVMDTDNWSSFTGWGPLPGIRRAAIERGTPELVGTRFRVVSTNGDTHAETIEAWDPERELVIRMDGFPSPLRWMATHFVERWSIEHMPGGARTAVRSFAMHPTRRAWVPALWLIRSMLRRAVDRHNRAVLDGAGARPRGSDPRGG